MTSAPCNLLFISCTTNRCFSSNVISVFTMCQKQAKLCTKNTVVLDDSTEIYNKEFSEHASGVYARFK